MKLRIIAPNHIEIVTPNKTIFFSYETPVAIETNDSCYVTEKKFSSTTSKHINQWSYGRKITKISQDELERIINE